MSPVSLTCMIAGRRRVRVTDDRAGPTGKEVARSRAEPPADGDIDRARLSLNQARPDQRHQAGPIYLAPDSRLFSVRALPITYSRVSMADSRVGAQITRLCRAVDLARIGTHSARRRVCENLAAWRHEVVRMTLGA